MALRTIRRMIGVSTSTERSRNSSTSLIFGHRLFRKPFRIAKFAKPGADSLPLPQQRIQTAAYDLPGIVAVEHAAMFVGHHVDGERT